nr:hypothetical protein [Tanacetum cinerariifolium]
MLPSGSEQYTTGIIGVRRTGRRKSTSIEEQYKECTCILYILSREKIVVIK